jgi:DHA3 family tetracycline resistance protein-like MFS transporter
MVRKLEATLVYYVLGAVTTLAGSVMYTTLAVYYVTVVKMNPFQLVLVGTVLELTYFLFEVPTGVVADTYSRRLSVVIGMFVIGFAFLLEGSLALVAFVLLAETIRGVGETFLSGATDAWLTDEVGEANVGKIYLQSSQINRLVGLAGIGLSVALASVRLNLPLLVGGGLYLLLGFFLTLVMPERKYVPTVRRAAPGQAVSHWQALRATFSTAAGLMRSQPVFLSLVAIEFFFGLSSEGFDRLWEAHLLTNFSFPVLGALKPVVWFGILGAGLELFSWLVIQVLHKPIETASRSARLSLRYLVGLHVLIVSTVIAFGFAGSFALAVAALLARVAVRAIAWPFYRAYLSHSTDSEARATVFSMIGQANAIGQVGGGPVVGAVGSLVSIRVALALSGLFMSPVILFFRRLTRQVTPSAGFPAVTLARPDLAETIGD